MRAPPGAGAGCVTSHLLQGTAWPLARPSGVSPAKEKPEQGACPPAWVLRFPARAFGISWMCTISNAFEDLVSWKWENWPKIRSGKL